MPLQKGKDLRRMKPSNIGREENLKYLEGGINKGHSRLKQLIIISYCLALELGLL